MILPAFGTQCVMSLIYLFQFNQQYFKSKVLYVKYVLHKLQFKNIQVDAANRQTWKQIFPVLLKKKKKVICIQVVLLLCYVGIFSVPWARSYICEKFLNIC